MTTFVPEPLPRQPGERYVSIMDARAVWPAVVVESRYPNVGMRPEVAAAFCDWSERFLTSQDAHGVAVADNDPRDVESDHVYFHDGAVYRLVWNQDAKTSDGRVSYDLVVENATPFHDGTSRIWIGAGCWIWDLG